MAEKIPWSANSVILQRDETDYFEFIDQENKAWFILSHKLFTFKDNNKCKALPQEGVRIRSEIKYRKGSKILVFDNLIYYIEGSSF